jgi:NAD(P)-dependent dehydrogenase (short-subunit alcohol dehydrogenase family)
MFSIVASATRTALVTGANRGLGFETSRQLAALGARVILTSRDPGEARAAAARLGAEGRTVEARALDVTDRASIDTLATSLSREGTRLDALVNNAGVALTGFDADVARRTLAVNFFGALAVTDALAPSMRDGGNVVMVSSGMGELSSVSPALRARLLDAGLTRDELVALLGAFPGDVEARRHRQVGWPSSAYAVSKVGLNALVRLLAPTLAPRRIRVNAVCPGWVRTDMGGRGAPRGVEQGAASIVWGATLEGTSGEPTGGFFRDGRPIAW